jgi:3-hydroxyacyl-CoA dehydrogenase
LNVEIEQHGATALIRFVHPPVNALSRGLVEALRRAMSAGIADAEVEAIVLSGGASAFSAGADIRDFAEGPGYADALRGLFDLVERARKPVVAAIEGVCLGGGGELALACHWRVANRAARFGFPEVTLGLLPGGGGTQRLPRLVGAGAALDLMLGGKAVDAARALALGLVDGVAAESAETEALALAAACPAVRRTGDMPPAPDTAQAVEAARSRAKGLAHTRIVDCVAAAGAGDLRVGLTLEAALFAELLGSIPSRALRHGFLGRRIAARVPGLEATRPAAIGAVTVVGGGLMGTGITLALLAAGLEVTLVEPRPEARDKARDTIARTVRRDVEKGRLSDGAATAQLDHLRMAADVAEGRDADLFIEAVFEDMEVKRTVFGAMEAAARPDAILASNTSTLDLDAIAALTQRPERVVGLHFFSPANVMKLLEVVRGARTSPETLVTAMAFAKAIGKSPVCAGVCDGFIGNRMFEEYLRQAWFLLEEGALPAQIDAALTGWGMAMGPVAVMDLAGQDIGWSIRRRRAIEQPDRPYSRIPDLVCELGRFGQKTGAGFYRYPDGRTAEPDAGIDALVIAESVRLGLARRDIADEEIVERCVLALINEGARIVGEGIAYRPVDIDVVYMDGYGFPARRGGPMFHADALGLPNALARIRQLAEGRHGWAWEPAPLLVELADKGADFNSLNR